VELSGRAEVFVLKRAGMGMPLPSPKFGNSQAIYSNSRKNVAIRLRRLTHLEHESNKLRKWSLI
jgi:hypothetical protein